MARVMNLPSCIIVVLCLLPQATPSWSADNDAIGTTFKKGSGIRFNTRGYSTVATSARSFRRSTALNADSYVAPHPTRSAMNCSLGSVASRMACSPDRR